MVGHLAKMKHATIRFRTHEPDYSDIPEKQQDWFDNYGNVMELLPKDAPTPLGKSVLDALRTCQSIP